MNTPQPSESSLAAVAASVQAFAHACMESPKS